MNRALKLLFLSTSLLAFPLAARLSAAPLTEADAVALARAEVAKRGAWADRCEYRAKPYRGGWHVTAWQIVYPEHQGVSRFVPGGFSSVLIDRGGRVVHYGRGS